LTLALKNAQQKQNDIISSAESLFLKRGFAATSMDQIATETGVTKQTVYRYFPSKNELFAAVMQNLRAGENRIYRFGEASFEQELLNYGQYLLAFHLRSKTLGLYRLMLNEGSRQALFDTFKNAGPKQMLQPLIEFLQQHSQYADLEFSAHMYATMILAPRNQLLMSGSARMKTSEQEQHVQKVTRLFLRMIKTKCN